MKRCFKCHTEKPIDEFYRHPMMGDGHLNKCKSCTKRDVARRHFQRMETPDGRAAERARGRDKYHRLYRGKRPNKQHAGRVDPLKRRARLAVQYAVRAGRLTKPDGCEACGGRGARIEAHHEDYSKPLDVNWLCSLCHGKRHRKRAA